MVNFNVAGVDFNVKNFNEIGGVKELENTLGVDFLDLPKLIKASKGVSKFLPILKAVVDHSAVDEGHFDRMATLDFYRAKNSLYTHCNELVNQIFNEIGGVADSVFHAVTGTVHNEKVELPVEVAEALEGIKYIQATENAFTDGNE